MAGRKPKASGGQEDKIKAMFGQNLEEMSVEDMQKAVLKVQLMREMVGLEQTQVQVQKYDELQESLKVRNEKRQAELANKRAQEEARQKKCRHKQGGKHTDIFRGNGTYAITGAKMMDGYTMRLECTRCGKVVFTPHPSLEFKDPERWAIEKAQFDKFLEMFEESENEIIRGPEFMFMKNGVPFVPERV